MRDLPHNAIRGRSRSRTTKSLVAAKGG
jgi:hypothetical protein